MKIVVKGTIVKFYCKQCGCVFVAGINAVSTPDKGENYYVNCPVCGAECNADCNAIKK